MSLDKRLNILLQSDVISLDTKEKIETFIVFLNKEYGFVLTEENSSPFVTHLAMMLSRIEKKQPFEEALEEDDIKEIQESASFKKAQDIVHHLESHLSLAIPKNEKDFLYMHLCVFCEREDVC